METRWSPLIVRGFETTFRPWMRWRLAGIHVAGLADSYPDDVPVLMVANHTSWWDGFILRDVQRRAGHRGALVTVMREDQLQRFPFFRWMGVAGLSPTPAGTRRALRCVQSFCHDDPPWVSYFPQGRIWPSWKRPLGFQRGVQLFIEAIRPVLVLPVGIHLEMLGKPVPSAFVSVGEPILVEASDRSPSTERLETAVMSALSIIYDLLDACGEDLPTFWLRMPASRDKDEPMLDAARSEILL